VADADDPTFRSGGDWNDPTPPDLQEDIAREVEAAYRDGAYEQATIVAMREYIEQLQAGIERFARLSLSPREARAVLAALRGYGSSRDPIPEATAKLEAIAKLND